MSTTPPGGPEYLDTTGSAPAASGNDNRKRLFALGGVVAAGAVIGGGAWAATSFFSTGAQPAEALPAGTIAYASVDLDPSGGQKIEAIRTLRKFPGFTDQVDLETDDDLRERLFDELTSSGECEGLDYGKDVEPWLGSRAAVAAVDAGGEEPAPVFVVQVTDAGAAEDGMATLLEKCGGQDASDGEAETGAWAVEGDWLVAGETQEVVDSVTAGAAKSSLADDGEFTRWTDEAGDDGIMSFYVAKSATKYVGDLADPGLLGPMGAGPDPMGLGEGTDQEVPDEVQSMLDEFDGMAATVRFDDGALEIEYAMSDYQPEMTRYFTSEAGVDLVEGLPEDTVAAFGLGFEEGWVQGMVDYVESVAPEGEMDVDELFAEAEAETGLSLPEDVETLMGEGVAVAIGPGISPDAIANGGPGEMPLGIKIKGDADDIQAVLDKLEAQAGPEVAPYLEVQEGDGFAVLGLQEEYRSQLESEGSLGDSAAYEEVVDEDSQSLLFVDFDADDDWLLRLAKDAGPDVTDNLEPLSALGISARIDDDVVHGMVKLTTD
jgi:hypothetical protein